MDMFDYIEPDSYEDDIDVKLADEELRRIDAEVEE